MIMRFPTYDITDYNRFQINYNAFCFGEKKKDLNSFLVQFYCLNQYHCLGIYYIYNSLHHENPL